MCFSFLLSAKNGNKKGEKNKKSNERTPDGDYERRNTGEDSRESKRE